MCSDVLTGREYFSTPKYVLQVLEGLYVHLCESYQIEQGHRGGGM